MKDIAIEGMTILVKTAVPIPGLTVVFSIVGLPSDRVQADGGFVYLDKTTIKVESVLSTAAPTADVVPYFPELNASITRSKSEDTLLLVEGDISDTVHAFPLNPGGSPVPTDFWFEITDAGQTRSKA